MAAPEFGLAGRVAVVTGVGARNGIGLPPPPCLPGWEHPWLSLPAVTESGEVADMDLSTWRASMARNLDASFLFARAVLPPLCRSGRGRLIMVASLTGPVMGMRGEVAYGAAKAGMVGLVRGVALDSAPNGVTVNAVAPGWIATDSQTSSEKRQGLRTPMKRSGLPSEVAGLIGYLSTDASSYITGQCLVIDGGNSIAEERE